LNLTEQKALEIALKALSDIGIWTEGLVDPKVEFFEKGDKDLSSEAIPIWYLSFTFSKEHSLGDLPSKYFVIVTDLDGLAKQITMRSGVFMLGYDAETDKYYKKPRPQPK
jgi:hypothetical protein